MKMLKKLALASAVSLLSVSAFAMEAMDDESMAASVGQAGIKINVVLPTIADNDISGTFGALQGDGSQYGLAPVATRSAASLADYGGNSTFFKGIIINQVIVHDADGLSATDVTGLTTTTGVATAAATNAGAIVIGDGTAADSTVIYESGAFGLGTLQPIVIDIDATGDSTGGTSGTSAMLNIKISLPTIHIKTGNIYVAGSGGTGAAITGRSAAIMNGNEIILGASKMNIQLGNENQGAMIVLNTAVTGGITINNFALNDVGGAIKGGSIAVASMHIDDNGAGSDLTLGVGIDAADAVSNPGAAVGLGGVYNGLAIALNKFGTTAAAGIGGADITMTGVKLGSAAQAVLGDVEIKGLQLAGTTLIIMGK